MYERGTTKTYFWEGGLIMDKVLEEGEKYEVEKFFLGGLIMGGGTYKVEKCIKLV